MSSISDRVKHRFNYYKVDRITRNFIKHNHRCFAKTGKGVGTDGPEVLFEINAYHSAHISYSYLANALAEKHGARVIAYSHVLCTSFWKGLIWKLSRFLPRSDFVVYRSFGASGFLQPRLSANQLSRASELSTRTLSGLNSKTDIESIQIDGTWIGDLVYDTYLKTFIKPTIDIEDVDFRRFLRDAISLYVFWDDYFKCHDVRAVNVSHCVYVNAMPLRIAVSRGIPAYQVHATHAYFLTEKNLFAYNDFFYFREQFNELPVGTQKAGLELASKRIEQRFAGKVGVDMSYSTKSAYGEYKSERLLQESDRRKVLIATHCFFDSPHSYGMNLFPDFHEWLNFLGKVTMETDYDWYIKTHPDYLAGTREIIDSFIERYPAFQLLPADSSHHQIITEGIDVALTTYGTIGFEYAALGIPVVNASRNNPHIAYNFNLHPRSIEEYGEILRDLDHIDLGIDKNEVYEYYFMKYIYNTNDWLFEDYNRMIDEAGGYRNQFTSWSCEYWIREWTPARHDEITTAMKLFLESGDFRLGNKHLGRNFELSGNAAT